MSTLASSPWKTKASNKEGEAYESAPAGTHAAICVAVIDLGTHTDTYQGESNTSRKIFFAWELTAEMNSKGEPFIVGEQYSWTLGKKAKLRGVVEGWSGKALADDEEFEIVSLIQKPCCLTLVSKVSLGGNPYVKVNQITAPMKGSVIPEASITPFVYHISETLSGESEPPIPEWVPYTLDNSTRIPVAEKIKKSVEWADRSPF